MPLDAAGMVIVYIQQVKHHDVFDSDLQYFIHLSFCCGCFWLTYAECQMLCIWQECGVFNCTLIVMRSVQYEYQTRSDHVGDEYVADCIHLSVSCILGVAMILLLAHCPYVSMGIFAVWVNYKQANNV